MSTLDPLEAAKGETLEGAPVHVPTPTPPTVVEEPPPPAARRPRYDELVRMRVADLRALCDDDGLPTDDGDSRKALATRLCDAWGQGHPGASSAAPTLARGDTAPERIEVQRATACTAGGVHFRLPAGKVLREEQYEPAVWRAIKAQLAAQAS